MPRIPSFVIPPYQKAIIEKYAKVRHIIGEPENPTPVSTSNGVWKQTYSKNGTRFGAIYYTEKYGACAVYGAIYGKYMSLGGEKGNLGLPKTDETQISDKMKGCFNHFEKGSIYWTPETGAHEICSSIYDKWAQLGWETGILGYPVSGEYTAPDKIGRFSHFQGGSIYWTPKTGAHAVSKQLRDKWEQLGWETGILGYPTSDTTDIADGKGKFNHFEKGSIYWTQATGVYEIHGSIYEKWAQLGWETGYLGYPVSDEYTAPDKIGKFSHFQGGSIYWTPETGAHAVHKEIKNKWEQLGWETGILGYPISDTSGTPATTTTCTSDFQGGRIIWNPSQCTVEYPYRNAKFILDSVLCHKKNDNSKHDELWLTAIALDNDGMEYTLPVFQIGRFKKGDSTKLNKVLFTLPINNPRWPKVLTTSLVLIEEDNKKTIKSKTDMNQIQKDVIKTLKQGVTTAIKGAVSLVGGPIETVIGGICKAIEFGFDGYKTVILGEGDDVLDPPMICTIAVPTIFGMEGNATSIGRNVSVKDKGAYYTIYYHWELA